jgi:iron complex outermembrane receptor protein
VTAPGEVIVIEGRAPGRPARDRARALGDAPFVTILHPDEHPASASVADALGTAAGAQARSLGGLGAYQSVSVRGAAPGHTAVLVDGIPLSRLAEVATDLGRYPLAALGEVQLYRGAVPIELGGAGIGGAVNLVSRLGRGEGGERVRASVGAGSFGAGNARLRYGDARGAALLAVSASYQRATGDYTYFTDGGTPLEPADDGYEVRRNNGFAQAELAARAGHAGGAGAGGVRLVHKRQRLPGSVARPARAAALSTRGAIADARGRAAAGPATGEQLAYAMVEQQHLRDRDGELGIGAQDRRYLTLAGGAHSAWRAPLGAHRVAGGLELRGERFRDADAGGARASVRGTRAAGAAAIAIDLAVAGSRVVITPAARLDVVRTAPPPDAMAPGEAAALPARWDHIPSPRLAARALLGGDVAIKGSAGWYVRLPTLVELFGDRGTIVASPRLAAERGPSVDAGVAWAPARARPTPLGELDRLLVEAAAFASRAEDTIAMITSAGYIARAQNVGSTRNLGAEVVVAGRLARAVSITAAYTRVAALQRAIDPNLDGKQVPRTPGHRAYARAELARPLAGRAVALWTDAALQSTASLDQAGFRRVPARVLVGAGARLALGAGLTLAAHVENLGGTRVVTIPAERAIDAPVPMALTDLAGFPLPGRSFYLAVDWAR